MPDDTPLLAGFTASIEAGDAPLTVVFTNTSTGTPITDFAWSFGDGATSKDENPTHIFQDPGIYTVNLTVSNDAESDLATLQIDVTAPAEAATTEYAQTINDLIPSIRAALRRPSDAKLHYRDILDVCNDLVRGYARDLHVAEANHRTDEGQCTINHLEASNYLLTVPGVQDVEASALMFCPQADISANPDNLIWRQMQIVPLDYYAERHMRDSLVCSFFAGTILNDGVKVKMNVSRETVEQSIWRVRYKKPVLLMLTLASRTPLPADFLPMLKLEAQLMCLSRIRDDSDAFYRWVASNKPLWVAMLADWRRRWTDFLETSNEPNYSPKIPFNIYRSRSARSPRYTVERHVSDVVSEEE